jgi:hypothetical protein
MSDRSRIWNSQGGPIRYLPPFEVIKGLVVISTSKEQLIVTVSYESLITMIKLCCQRST